MLKSCKYCGRIHDSKYDCGFKPKPKARHNPDSPVAKVRNSSKWQTTRDYIRARDNNICQLCLIKYPGMRRQYEYEGLSVHHITKLEEDESRAFDANNLITLCSVHHEMAEDGTVPKDLLIKIAKDNTQRLGKYPPT